MSTSTDDDTFVLRTHTALVALKHDADRILRNLPAHHACPDRAPCRNCEALRLIHLRIDDHLTQLEDANLLKAPA